MIRMVRYLTVIIFHKPCPLLLPSSTPLFCDTKNTLPSPFKKKVLHLPTSYYHSIPAAPELGQSRKVDISRLRDIRKRLDTGHITVKELEVIAVECVDELVELCSGKSTKITYKKKTKNRENDRLYW